MSTLLRLTVDEYERMVSAGAFDELNRRIELFRGELREMSPAGPLHDDIIDFLTHWSIANTNRSEVHVRIQGGLSLPELDSQPEPDVLWVRSRRYLSGHPRSDDVLLVIEVAHSSLHDDRVEKALLYSQAGIREFWVVNIADRAILVHRDPAPDGYQSIACHGRDSCVSPLIQPAASLIVSEVFPEELD